MTFPLVPAGTWQARAIDWALGFTQSTNREQLAVEFMIVEPGDAENMTITWYGHFTEKTMDRTLESMRMCGWTGDDLADLTGLDRNDVYLVIDHEDDDRGELRARVKWVNAKPTRGVALKERMSPGDAAGFAERMRGHVLAQRQRASGAATTTTTRTERASKRGTTEERPSEPPPPSADGIGGDDIPF